MQTTSIVVFLILLHLMVAKNNISNFQLLSAGDYVLDNSSEWSYLNVFNSSSGCCFPQSIKMWQNSTNLTMTFNFQSVNVSMPLCEYWHHNLSPSLTCTWQNSDFVLNNSSGLAPVMYILGICYYETIDPGYVDIHCIQNFTQDLISNSTQGFVIQLTQHAGGGDFPLLCQGVFTTSNKDNGNSKIIIFIIVILILAALGIGGYIIYRRKKAGSEFSNAYSASN